MANFIFNEGATLASGAGIDWVSTAYDCALVDDSVSVPVNTNTWADFSAGSTAVQAFANKALTTSGALAADPVIFTQVSTTNPAGRFTGFVIKRNSDNLLLAWIDTGFSSLGGSIAVAPIGDILGANLNAADYTFQIRPGLNNESAWLRL
jgi:hypothetical protein